MELDTAKPIAWKYIRLAMLPGLVAFAIRVDLFEAIPGAKIFQNYTEAVYSLTVMNIAILAMGIILCRKITPWLFPAIGWLISILPAAANDFLLPPTAYNSSLHNLFENIWIVGVWGVSITLFWLYRRNIHLPWYGWILLGCAILAAPDSLIIRGALVLSVAAGLLIVEKHHLRAGLIPLTSMYLWVEAIFDPGYALPDPVATVVEVTLVVAFLILPVLWVLRARSDTVALLGLVVPPSSGLLAGEIIRSMAVGASYDLSPWFTRGGGSLQIILILLVTTMLYRRDKRSEQSPQRVVSSKSSS